MIYHVCAKMPLRRCRNRIKDLERRGNYYAGTSLSCAGIQRWKSVSFHCWTAKNLVGESWRRRMTPTPYPPLNGHPELVRWAMRRRWKMTPHPYPPTPKWSSRVGEMSNEEEEEDDPHPLPTPPQMVLTVKNSRWVIICVFHARPPCTHYTAVPAYWDPEGSDSLMFLKDHWAFWM